MWVAGVGVMGVLCGYYSKNGTFLGRGKRKLAGGEWLERHSVVTCWKKKREGRSSLLEKAEHGRGWIVL